MFPLRRFWYASMWWWLGLEDSSNGPMSLVTPVVPSSPAKVTQHTGLCSVQWRTVEVNTNSRVAVLCYVELGIYKHQSRLFKRALK